ncbi:MAG: hypothetical protein KKC68_03860 [Candidatus Thermoplasmatota archaeon]|nr:hypothetical protein [Candidatus Thermoplasmatota archaeon]MBU1940886.1 hypothetical protein [Candidatus Thermoplasmatota archaeon]
MGCITVSVEKSFKERLAKFSWVNWSEIGREELLKKYIFENYIKTGKITKEEEKFCEKVDWHPVDELPLKKEFIERLKKTSKGHYTKSMNSQELKNWFEEL